MSSESNMDAGLEAMVMLLDPGSSQRELIQMEQVATQENVAVPDISKQFPELAGDPNTSKPKDADFIQYIQRRDNLEAMLEQAQGQKAGRIKRTLDVMAEMHVVEKESSNRARMYLDMSQAGEATNGAQEEEFYDFSGPQKRPHSPDEY